MELAMSRSRQSYKRRKNRFRYITHGLDKTKRYALPPPPPVIAAKLLHGDQLSFREFILDEKCAPYLALLFGARGTSAATMLRDFRKATKTPFYFGYHNPKPGRKGIAAERLRQHNVALKIQSTTE
jgi:hypothetical protein